MERYLKRRRDPKQHGPAHKGAVETLGRDTNNRMRHAVEHLRFSDDRGIAVKTLLPHLVADYRDRMSVAPEVFGGFEAAAEDGTDSQRVEIVRRYDGHGCPVRPV